MKIIDIHQSSKDFDVLETTTLSQVATMILKPGEATGDHPETHPESEQTVLVLEGRLAAEIGKERAELGSGQCVVVPANTPHLFRNDGEETVLVFTTYSPPAYPG